MKTSDADKKRKTWVREGSEMREKESKPIERLTKASNKSDEVEKERL